MSQFLIAIQSTRYGTMIIAKETIEREAKAAAQQGLSLNDACPYPFGSEAGQHFRAVYQQAAQEEGAA